MLVGILYFKTKEDPDVPSTVNHVIPHTLLLAFVFFVL
jgi:hypothetical protein